MKQCPRCGRRGPFTKNRARPDGLSYWCKHCMYATKDHVAHAAAQRQRNQTAHGRAVNAWNGIRYRSENTDGCHPAYARIKLKMTRTEFMQWAEPAFAQWLQEHPNVRPSVDRIRLRGHYEIKNLRIISLAQNSKLQGAHKNVYAPPGKAWCGVCQRYLSVTRFDKNRTTAHGLQHRCRRHQAEANQRCYVQRRARLVTDQEWL